VCVCDGASATVAVERCPMFPDYVPCRKRKNGTVKCPRRGAARRVLKPFTGSPNGAF